MNNTLVAMPNTLDGDYCDASYLRTVGDNLLEIRRCVGEMGYNVNAVPDTLNKIIYGLMPSDLKSRFNDYDAIIFRISRAAVDYITPNINRSIAGTGLPALYVWQDRPTDIRNQLLRWFRWCNEQKEIIDNPDCTTNRQPLCDVNRELTTDINGDIIFCEVE